MAGSPTWGKMSTGIRVKARTAQSAMATKATTTVNGLDRAANTKRILSCFRGQSSHHLRDEGFNVSRCSRYAQESSPHAQAGQNIVNFRLSEKPLCFGNLIDVAESGLIARCRLLRGRARGRYLYRRAGGNAARTVQCRHCTIPLCPEIHSNLLGPSCLRPDGGALRSFPGVQRRQVKNRKRDAKAECIVLNVGS